MADVIKKVVQIDAGNSPKTVKELKNQISQLRDALVGLDTTSDEYKIVVEQLSSAQQTLTTVMNAGKASTEAADGSYNKLVQTMKALQQQWKATTDEAERAELGEQINEINNQLKELDATLGNHQRNVGNYKNDIVDALNEVQGEAKQTQMSYSEAWGKMQKSTEQTRAKFESIQKTAAGITSAYAAVQGATALLGIENESLEKTFVKVQSAMALAQGVGGMKDLVEGVSQAKVAFGGAFTAAKTFITGLNGIKAAIIGTGIGALVVGIGLLIANWDKFASMFDDKQVNAQLDIDTSKIKELQDNIEFQQKLQKNVGEIKQAQGQTEVENLKEQLELNKQLIDTVKSVRETYYERLESMQGKQHIWFSGVSKKDVEKARENYNSISKIEEELFNAASETSRQLTIAEINEKNKQLAERQAAAEEKKRIAEEEQNTINSIIERLKNPLQIRKEQYDREKELLKGNLDALKQLEEEYQKDVREIIQTNDDEAYAAIESYYSDVEKIIDKNISKLQTKNQNILDGYDESNATSLDNNGDSWIEEDELNNYKAYLDGRLSLLQANTDAENQLIQSKIDMLNEQLAVQQMLGQDTSNTTAQIETLNEQIIENNDKVAEATKENNKKKAKSDEEYEINKKKRDKLVAEFSISTASNVLKSLSSIMGEESKAGKAAAIAAATIDTYQAANAAYKSMAGIPVVGPALGAAAAAAAVIAGIANVKQIMKTDASNANGSVAATNTSPNLSLDMMMPMQYTRNLQTDTEIDELNQSNKVYVVEEDITSTQQKVAVSEQSASF